LFEICSRLEEPIKEPMNHCYLIESGSKTYIGATKDPDRRLRQHNRELTGGAKATAGYKWVRVILVSGFPDWKSALQFEWAWKYQSRQTKKRGLESRIDGLIKLLMLDRPTSKASDYKTWLNGIFLHIDPLYRAVLTKIESHLSTIVSSGFQLFITILPYNPSNIPSNIPSFPNKMSTKSVPSTGADLIALTKAIQALVEQQATNNKVVTAILDRLCKMPIGATAAAVGAEAEPAIKGKRGRKARSDKVPKVKPAIPAAAEGTVRFGTASDGDYKEFSNFYKSPFTVGGKDYISVANYFNSMKFAEDDEAFAEEIRNQKNPALTRAKATSVKDHAARADWETEKLNIMRAGLLAKFNSDPALKQKLLDTGDSPLESTIEEEMRMKGFWSVGEDATGENNMGKLLMSVRNELAGAAPVATGKKAKAVTKKAPAKDADSDSDSDSESESESEAPAKTAAKPAAKTCCKDLLQSLLQSLL
jgi:N-glycosidase YbiA